MSVARAYADFDQHPEAVRTRLDVAGFEASHYPAKRVTDASGRERYTSRSDLNMAVDIINTALVRPDINTFMIFSGDKDFIRLVTTLRNRLGKRVIIAGVPGSVSPELVVAAGEEDMIEMEPSADVDAAVIEAIDTYINQLHEGFVPTQSHMSRTLWRFLDRALLPSEHIEAKVMEFLRKGVLSKRQTINGQGQELVTTELNPDHPLVQQAIAAGHAAGASSLVEHASYCTDASLYTRLGLPTVVYGPGSIAQAHTKDEWITIEQLETGVQAYEALVRGV